MSRTKIAPQIFAAISGSLLIAGIGYHIGWTSPALPKILIDTSIPVNSNQAAMIVSMLTLGGAIGPISVCFTVDKFGRRATMLMLAIPFLASSVMTAVPQNYWWYYVARLLSGFGVGASFTVVPMYLGEIAEDRIRGGIGILFGVMFNFGVLVPLCTGPWVSLPILASIGALIPIIFIMTFVWVPETPYYYLMKNKPDKARKSLVWLRGTTDVDDEFKKVTKNVELDLKNAGTLRELFTDRANRRAMLIMIGLFTAQQITGTLVIQSYTTIIFETVASSISANVSVIIIGVVQLVATILVSFIADKKGRRTLLIWSMLLSSISLLGEAAYFHLQAIGSDVSGISWLPVTAIVGYVTSFTLGVGTLPSAIISEIFACNIKAYASTISNVYLSFAAGFISFVYPNIVQAWGVHVAFYFFATGTVVFMILIYIFLPETKGKSFHEIQIMLQGISESREKLHPIRKSNYGSSRSSIYSIATNDVPVYGTITMK
ncbi:facilitated trehalose transporter Tret1-like [Athalia rosae]|uniref:facilitated trehalose transporter Tret1-like n=1 Tax=Athalia rosae TaxID=37344 RepID=UPI0020345D91|nr:facilitated trehalose transporter Tret1-like [Athalia rosae]